jgi:hypothetical protein
MKKAQTEKHEEKKENTIFSLNWKQLNGKMSKVFFGGAL